MKLSHISYCIAICLLSFQPAIATAGDTLMLEGFDPLQTGPATYSQAKKTPIAPKYAEAVFHHAGDPVTGNSNGRVTLVEFFDYRCSHCMAMSPILHSIVSKNADVRVVYKEFPIRGKTSVFAAKAALAANNQGKYIELHDAMLDSDNLDETKVLSLAKSVGLDVDKLQTDMNSVAIEEAIRENYELARQMGIYGTPTFYIAPNNASDYAYLISGEVEQSYLQNLLGKLSR
jgi:protein-disulfide isomerase